MVVGNVFAKPFVIRYMQFMLIEYSKNLPAGIYYIISLDFNRNWSSLLFPRLLWMCAVRYRKVCCYSEKTGTKTVLLHQPLILLTGWIGFPLISFAPCRPLIYWVLRRFQCPADLIHSQLSCHHGAQKEAGVIISKHRY